MLAHVQNITWNHEVATDVKEHHRPTAKTGNGITTIKRDLTIKTIILYDFTRQALPMNPSC